MVAKRKTQPQSRSACSAPCCVGQRKLRRSLTQLWPKIQYFFLVVLNTHVIASVGQPRVAR